MLIFYHTSLYTSKRIHIYFYRLLALALLSITLVQSFRFSSNMNLSNILNANDHIKLKILPQRTNLIKIILQWNQFL